MALHPDSLAVMHYLKNNIEELIEPTEHALIEAKVEPNARKMFEAELVAIGLHFACADGDLSENVAGFLGDIQHFFWDSPDTLTKSQHREIFLRHPVARYLREPPSLYYLKKYDSNHGTDHAAKAKAMFFRFANAVTKADGKVTSAEYVALERFKQILYGQDLVAVGAGEKKRTVGMALHPDSLAVMHYLI